jgi:hypothetical protein
MKELDQYTICSHDEAEFFHKARQAAQQADSCAGEEKKKQVGGSHYQVAKMQVWDIIDAYHLDPYTSNIIKYALRFPYKAGRQDIEKLIHYAEKLHTVYDDVKEHYYAGA